MIEIDPQKKWRISARLKATREAQTPKLSQSQLARRVQQAGLAELQPGRASRLELGYADATWKEVQAFAAALGVSPEWLAGIDKAETTLNAQPRSTPPPAPVPAVPPAPPPVPVVPVAPAPAPQPVGLTKASVMAAAQLPPPPPAPVVEEPPIPVPDRGNLTVSDYRLLLGRERRKAEEALMQKGLSASEWRRWRNYTRELTEVLRGLHEPPAF